MEIKNSEVIQAIDVLNELSDKEMPVEITFKVINTLEQLFSFYRPYLKSLEKLKEQFDEGSELEGEVKKLLDITVEGAIPPFTKNELIESGIELTPSQLVRLKPLIVEVDDG